MKKKHIYLHIGTTKTGTTSIQAFLMHNRKLLKANSYIVYTPNKTSNTKDKTTPRLRSLIDTVSSYKDWLYHGGKPQQWLEQFIDNIKNANADNIILSEELLWSIISSPAAKKQQVFTQFIKMLREFSDVTVIIYLRRQDYYIMSSYQQSLKGGNLSGKTCQQWCSQKKNTCINWRAHYKARLQYLTEIVGKENIRVRIFEQEQFIDKSLITDFMNSVGLNMTDEYALPKNKRNPGLSSFMAEIIRCMSIYYRGKIPLSPFIIPKNKKNNILFNQDRKHEFLSPSERITLMQNYKKDNEWVAKEFLNRHDSVLFNEPLPNINDPWSEYKLNLEEVKKFFHEADFLDQAQKSTMQNQVLKALKNPKFMTVKLHIIWKIQDLTFRIISFLLKIPSRCKQLIKIFSDKFAKQS